VKQTATKEKSPSAHSQGTFAQGIRRIRLFTFLGLPWFDRLTTGEQVPINRDTSNGGGGIRTPVRVSVTPASTCVSGL